MVLALLFLAFVWYLFFFRLDGMALTDPDETFYAQTAKEMIAERDWLTPHIFGKPQFEKPALFYWLVKISFKTFGVNEFAARLPSAVSGAAGIAAIYFLGSLFFGKRAGAIAAVILATNVEYVILSRACVTDMTLFVFMLLGALFFFYGLIKGGLHNYLLSSVFFALAVLTKGPMAIVLPGFIFLAYFIFTKDWKSLGKVPLLWMGIVFLAVASPWYILMFKVHGSAFTEAFFGFQNVTRFLQSEHKIGSQVYYNIPILLGGFFPWSVFLPLGAWHAWKKTRAPISGNERKGIVFSAIWFLAIFLFFTASSTKLPTYIFPCFLPAALITALCWDDFIKSDIRSSFSRGMSISYYVLLAVVLAGSIAAWIYLSGRYPLLVKHIMVSCGILIFGMAMSFAAFLNGKRMWTFVLISYAVMLFLYPVSKLILPDLESFETSKSVASELKKLMAPGDRLGSEDRYVEGLTFYTGKKTEWLNTHQSVVDFFGSKGRVWGVLKEKNHIQLYTLDTPPLYSQPTYMVYKVGKRAIVTNMVPQDGKYIVKRGRVK